MPYSASLCYLLAKGRYYRHVRIDIVTLIFLRSAKSLSTSKWSLLWLHTFLMSQSIWLMAYNWPSSGSVLSSSWKWISGLYFILHITP